MHKILKDIELVAFDIMGVIYTEPSLIRNGLFPIYSDRFSYEYIKDLYNNIKSNVDGDISLWKGLGVENVKEAREHFLDFYVVDRGFEEFRKFLDVRSIRKGIISNMPEEWGDYISQKLNLIKDFDPILFSSDIGVSKPDYGKYDEFLNRAGVRGEKVLFIDDKLKNLEMAKRLGMKTVQYYRNEDNYSYKPDLIIGSFKELL